MLWKDLCSTVDLNEFQVLLSELQSVPVPYDKCHSALLYSRLPQIQHIAKLSEDNTCLTVFLKNLVKM